MLGAHPTGRRARSIRTLRRGATDVAAVVGEHRHPMRRVHDEGVFEVTVPGPVTDYRIDVDGRVADDPYRHLPTLGEFDLQLIGEGRHERLWTVLGARPLARTASRSPCGRRTPQGVRVVGDFTGWGPHDGWPMRSMGGSGVWELLVPDAAAGQRYKFRILGRDGVWREKADPLARLRGGAGPDRVGGVRLGLRVGDADWLARRTAGRSRTASR